MDAKILPLTLVVAAVALSVACPATAQSTQTAPADLRFYNAKEANPTSVVLGSSDPRSGYIFELTLDPNGAAVRELKLANHFETVADTRLWQRDPNAYLRARKEDPAKYQGHYTLLRSVVKDDETVLPYATRRLWVRLEDAGRRFETDLSKLPWVQTGPPEAIEGGRTISFRYRLLFGADPNVARDNYLQMVKTYEVRKGSYSVKVSMRLENRSGSPLRVGFDQLGPTGVTREDPRRDWRRAGYGKLKPAENAVQVSLKDVGDLPITGRSDESEPMVWVGLTNKFFASMMYMIPPADSPTLAAAGYNGRFYLRPAEEVGNGGVPSILSGVQVGVTTISGGKIVPQLRLAPGESRTVAFDVFAGPQMRDVFTDPEAAGFLPLYADLSYVDVTDVGTCFCAWDWLTLLIKRVLEWLTALAFGNWGVGIILLVFVVRLLLHPLTKKSQLSMHKMQKLGPQMQKLKEKYADDKNALNKEMMKLYKEGGATPIMGCLPMFLQMPIWIGLYTTINSSVELRHAAFLPVWLTDLAAPDALLSWGTDLWLIGPSLNLLPLLLAVAMFLQQKLNPQMSGASATATPEQQMQQKMMRIFFPVMMLVIFYKAPSGLNLYIMASTFAGVAEQYVIRKHLREKEAAEAGSQVTVKAPGKKARGSRPKKPKGPFNVKG